MWLAADVQHANPQWLIGRARLATGQTQHSCIVSFPLSFSTCLFRSFDRKFCNNRAPGCGLMKELRFVVLLGLLAVLSAACLAGQTNAGQENSPSSPATPSVNSSGPADSQVGSAPSQIVEYAPPPAEYARAKAYSNTRYRHIFIGALYEIGRAHV